MNRENNRWALVLLTLLCISGLMACSSTPIAPAPRGVVPAERPVLGTPFAEAAPTQWVKDLSELPKGTVSHVSLVYFHRTERCTACLNAENYTRETLDKYFADQIQRGLISLQVLDVEKPESAALVQKFDASGSALYLSVVLQGIECLCPNQDIWFFTANKYLFVDTLRKKLAALVGGA